MAQFSIPLATLAANAKADLETVVRVSTLQLFRKVTERSPVGNPELWKGSAPKGYVGGRFRANWNVSSAAPNFDTTASVDQGRATVEIQKSLTLPVGGVMWLSNGLPYARKLEYGHSKQAPGGMVRLAAAEFSTYVSQAVTGKGA